MKHRMVARMVTLAVALTLAPIHAAAEDVEVGEQAGEAIGRLAEAVGDFRLTTLPADLQVEARSMTFDYRQGQLLYEGAVHVKHGRVRMDADELKISFEPKNPQDVKQIRAAGNVRVVHETETASGRVALYDPERAIITITGDARLGSGPNKISGEKVIVFLDEGRAVIEGGGSGPVRAHIEPKSKDAQRLLEKGKQD